MGLVAWCGVVGGCVLAWPAVAAACGGGGVTIKQTSSSSSAGTVADAQRVVISSRANGTTDFVVQVGVSYTNADYGVLIPVPSEPTVDPDPNLGPALDELAASTAPTVTIQTVEYEEGSGDAGGSGIGCACAGSAVPARDKSTGDGGTTSEVTVSAPTNIGPITVVSLTANDPDAVHGWLDTNGFVIPDAQLPVLDSYVGQGRYFIAIKRNEATTSGDPTSVALHYTLAGQHRQLSLGFAQLGAAPVVSFTVFIAAPSLSLVHGPSTPFETLVLGDLPEDYLAADNYAGAVKEAVRRHASKAFVAEALYFPPWSVPLAFRNKIFEPASSIARFSTVLLSADLTQDVIFDGPLPATIPSHINVTVDRSALGPSFPVKYASVGWMLAVALGRALRRWGRG